MENLGPRKMPEAARKPRPDEPPAQTSEASPAEPEAVAAAAAEQQDRGVLVRLKKQVAVRRGVHQATAPVTPPVTLRQLGCEVVALDHEPFAVDPKQLLMCDRSPLFERVVEEG